MPSWPQFPALRPQDLLDARLYADREQMLAALPIARQGIVAEVGVALGDFSHRLIEMLHPREFVAIDSFKLHEIPALWGRSTNDIFRDANHRTHYEKVMAGSACAVIIREGESHLMLETFPDRHFDLIYVDADHSYQAVRLDALAASRKIRANGFVVFNDYILYDHLGEAGYGVVPAVNELVVDQGWRVVGFALHHQMFCDVAVRPPWSAGLDRPQS